MQGHVQIVGKVRRSPTTSGTYVIDGERQRIGPNGTILEAAVTTRALAPGMPLDVETSALAWRPGQVEHLGPHWCWRAQTHSLIDLEVMVVHGFDVRQLVDEAG